MANFQRLAVFTLAVVLLFVLSIPALTQLNAEKQGVEGEATQKIRKIFEANHRDGTRYFGKGDYPKAIQSWKVALLWLPSQVIRDNITNAYTMWLDNPDKGQQLPSDQAQQVRNQHQAWRRLTEGYDAYLSQDYPAAIAQFEESLKSDNDLTEAYKWLGCAAFEAGRRPEAEAAFRELIQRQPDLILTGEVSEEARHLFDRIKLSLPRTGIQSRPLLIFFDPAATFDQQFQPTFTDLLREDGKGFKFALLARGEQQTSQAMSYYQVREEEFPIVLVLTPDEKRVEKRWPQKRNARGTQAARNLFRQITGKEPAIPNAAPADPQAALQDYTEPDEGRASATEAAPGTPETSPKVDSRKDAKRQQEQAQREKEQRAADERARQIESARTAAADKDYAGALKTIEAVLKEAPNNAEALKIKAEAEAAQAKARRQAEEAAERQRQAGEEAARLAAEMQAEMQRQQAQPEKQPEATASQPVEGAPSETTKQPVRSETIQPKPETAKATPPPAPTAADLDAQLNPTRTGLARGMFEEALVSIDDFLAKHPGYPAALELKAAILRAGEAAKTARAQAAQETKARIDEALRQSQGQQYDDALKLLGQVLSEQPSNTQAQNARDLVLTEMVNTARTIADQGDKETAVRLAQKVLEAEAAHAAASALLARLNGPRLPLQASTAVQQPTPAEQKPLDPYRMLGNPGQRLRYARMLLTSRQFDEALRVIDSVFALEPGSAEARRLEERVMAERADWLVRTRADVREARKAAQALHDKYPNNKIGQEVLAQLPEEGSAGENFVLGIMAVHHKDFAEANRRLNEALTAWDAALRKSAVDEVDRFDPNDWPTVFKAINGLLNAFDIRRGELTAGGATVKAADLEVVNQLDQEGYRTPNELYQLAWDLASQVYKNRANISAGIQKDVAVLLLFIGRHAHKRSEALDDPIGDAYAFHLYNLGRFLGERRGAGGLALQLRSGVDPSLVKPGASKQSKSRAPTGQRD